MGSGLVSQKPKSRKTDIDIKFHAIYNPGREIEYISKTIKLTDNVNI